MTAQTAKNKTKLRQEFDVLEELALSLDSPDTREFGDSPEDPVTPMSRLPMTIEPEVSDFIDAPEQQMIFKLIPKTTANVDSLKRYLQISGGDLKEIMELNRKLWAQANVDVAAFRQKELIKLEMDRVRREEQSLDRWDFECKKRLLDAGAFDEINRQKFLNEKTVSQSGLSDAEYRELQELRALKAELDSRLLLAQNEEFFSE